MYTIIVSSKDEGKTVSEIIALFAEEKKSYLPITECLVIIDKKVLDYSELFSVFPKKEQKILVYKLSYGG
ncbi:MAG TPA: hypothetical protein VFC41_01345 [Anaerovoracaceae bacterium]|nr:hypothetical protein [Anaerovoracaceae bacterium]